MGSSVSYSIGGKRLPVLRYGTVIDPKMVYLPKPTDPMTITVSTKLKPKQYDGLTVTEVRQDYAHRWELYKLYTRNGPAVTVIDAYNHALWTNGWRIESDNEVLAEAITKDIHKKHIENSLKTMTEDGLVYGYGVAEKAVTRDIFNPQMAIVPRCARQFDVLIDDIGLIRGIRQYDLTGKPFADLPAKKAIVLMPMMSSEGSGKSLLEQCMTPLLWWEQISQACADAIQRHGNTIFDIQIAGPNGTLAPVDAMTGMESITTDLNSRAELVTNINTQIKELNQAGVPHVAVYGNWVLQQICAASGAPDELFGIGAGKTGLLADTKKEIFYDKLESMQHTLEPQIDDQIIDVLAMQHPELVGKPGEAHFTFNNPSSDNDIKKAEYCKKLMEIDPFNPIVDLVWIHDYLGIKMPKVQPIAPSPYQPQPFPNQPYPNTTTTPRPLPGGVAPGVTQ